MKPRRDKGRMGPFVPLLKDTLATDAWRAASHGARSLYVSLKAHYNRNLGNAVYISTRDAGEELGSNRTYISRWFRELEHYGFIVMVSPAHHGVQGHGKAPHWRLTEEPYQGQSPTRDFLRWRGAPFHKNRSRGPQSGARVDHKLVPEVDHKLVPLPSKGGPQTGAIQEQARGPQTGAITSLTTTCLRSRKG